MSFTMHGVAVSSGIAIGHAHLVSHALLEVVHYQVPKHLIQQEIERFEQAVDKVKHDLDVIRRQLPAGAPAELGAFVNTHLMILADKHLSDEPKTIIREEQCNAEWAIKQQMDDLVVQFERKRCNRVEEREARPVDPFV